MVVRRTGALVRLKDGVAGDEFVGAFADVEHEEDVFAFEMADAFFVFREVFPSGEAGRVRFGRGRAADE